MQDREVLITFDYELYLGARSGTVRDCLLQPTAALLAILKKHGATAVFFVDTTYLLRLSEERDPRCAEDFKSIASQLREAAADGHFIFPHIHPHWLDAVYESTSGNWKLTDYSKYRFHMLSPDTREMLFSRSIDLLRRMLADVPGLKPVNGYRAGGWSLQPFADFRPLFVKHGILYDFSVIRGFRNLSDAQFFDFTNSPQEEVYRFSEDPCVEDKEGQFTEYAISTIAVDAWHKLLGRVCNKLLWKAGVRSMGKGSGISIKESESKGAGSIGSMDRETVSIELLTWARLRLYKRFIRENAYVHFISHPKMLSVHNVTMFSRWMDYASANFTLKTDFRYFRHGYSSLN